jgi:hypothetical protein
MSETGETSMPWDKAIRRADGPAVPCCESGHPHLGGGCNPGPKRADHLLAGRTAPTRLGDCAHGAPVVRGPGRARNRAGATPADRDGSNGDESVQALERRLELAYQARRGTLFDRAHGWGWCVGCGRNPVCADDGNDTCPACPESC